MIDLQDFLIKKRKELNLSLRNAAKLIGISHSYLSTLEKGTDPRNNAPVKPTPETLKMISDAYNVSYDYLMQLSGYINAENNTSQLNKKDEKDIQKTLNETLEKLENSQNGLMFDGKPMDDETRELLKISLENSMRIAKQAAKKYTPKKYRK